MSLYYSTCVDSKCMAQNTAIGSSEKMLQLSLHDDSQSITHLKKKKKKLIHGQKRTTGSPKSNFSFQTRDKVKNENIDFQ